MEDIVFSIYQKLGDYFTGKTRKNLVYITLVLIFIFLNFVSYRYRVVVNTSVLHLVFSSLVQALLALVALMGVVSIFKLQSLKSSEDQLLMIAREQTYTYYIGAPPPTIELLLEKIEPIIQSNNLNQSNHLYVLRKNIRDIKLSKDLTIDYTIKYTIFTFGVTLLALIFLIFASQISTFYLGINSLYLMFILVAYSLFLVGKGFSGFIKH